MFETFQDDVVYGTCRKDTASAQVSIWIQFEDFSESFYFLFTVKLRGSAVETAATGPSEVTKTFAELIASCVERPILARELFVNHCLVQLEPQNEYNRK